MFLEDLVDFSAHFGPAKSGMGDSEGDGHYLDGDDTDLIVWIGRFDARDGVEFGEEICIGVKTDADAMDEDDGEFGVGGV